MQRNVVIWDVICYLIFPIVIWHIGKDLMGNYYAMLISSVPGIIYSIIRFLSIKKVNLFGIFMIANLVVGTLVDVLSGSAIQMLWNDVFYSLVMGLLFFVTIILNRPFALFVALDVVEMQGHNRKMVKELFFQRKILPIFKLITFGFAFREIILSSINIWLIIKYGVNSFDKGIIVKQILNWGITGLSIYGFIYISKLLNSPKNTDDFSHSKGV